eukprot:COSAG04_NODE_4951_length_1809_cov_2.254386_2_plen_199_part_01
MRTAEGGRPPEPKRARALSRSPPRSVPGRPYIVPSNVAPSSSRPAIPEVVEKREPEPERPAASEAIRQMRIDHAVLLARTLESTASAAARGQDLVKSLLKDGKELADLGRPIGADVAPEPDDASEPEPEREVIEVEDWVGGGQKRERSPVEKAKLAAIAAKKLEQRFGRRAGSPVEAASAWAEASASASAAAAAAAAAS